MQQSVSRSRKRSLCIAFLSVLLVGGFAVLCFASEGGGEHHVNTGAQLKDFGWRVVDFAGLVAIIWWALKKANVKGALADRRAGIEKALNDAVAAREAAERKLEEYSEKLAKANQEIDGIYAAIRREGELEKERIIAEAKISAQKIREQAVQAADQEVLKARMELREEAVRLAVELAEKTLKEKINKDDQNRLVGDYLAKVVHLQ